MAKRSAAEKARTHEQILQHASETFRKNGSGVGIGALMKNLGLTHGGFYRHFDSKDALFLDAVALALVEIAKRLDQIAQSAPVGRQLEAIITAYLSPEHLEHPETWCALASLAPDVARQDPTLRKRLDASTSFYMETIAKYMPGETVEQRRQAFLILFSGMAGSIAMIRVLGNPDMQQAVLKMTRDYYLRTFAGMPSM